MFDLFSPRKGIEKVVSMIGDGVDASILTKEEVIKYHLDFLGKYEPFKLIQRIIVFIVIPAYVIWATVTMSLYTYGTVIGDMSYVSASEGLGVMLREFYGDLAYMICGFYFCGGMLEGSIKAFRK